MSTHSGFLLSAVITGSRHLSTSGTILGFHGITSSSLPSEEIAHVPADLFRITVEASRELGEIIALDELVRRHQAGLSTAGLIAITFDDAYASLFLIADYVERHEVPVTVFPVVTATNEAQAFWWDRICDLAPRASADQWSSLERSYGIHADERAVPSGAGSRYAPLRQRLLSQYRGRWVGSLEAPLQELESSVGYRTPQRSMNWDELGRFVSLPTVDVAIHTVSHPVLPLLPDDELRREVSDALAALRERFAKTLPILAIPYGLFDQRTVRLSHEAGMVAALSMSQRTLRGFSGTSEIPRFCMTRGETAFKLALRVGGVHDHVRRLQGKLERYPVLPV